MRLVGFRECNISTPKGEYYGKSLTHCSIIWICRILVTRRVSLILKCQPPWAFSGMQNCDHRHCSGDVVCHRHPKQQIIVFPSFVALQTHGIFPSPFQAGLVQRLWDALLPHRCQVQVALFLFFLKKGSSGSFEQKHVCLSS